MTQLLNQAFAAANRLSQQKQDDLAELILQEINRQQKPEVSKKSRMLKPVTEGSSYTDTSINHDAVLVEFAYINKLPKQAL